MLAYLLRASGKTSDEKGVWTRELRLGDEMCDRFSLVVDRVIGGASVDDEVFVQDEGNGSGFGLDFFDAASSSPLLPVDVFSSMHCRLLIQPSIHIHPYILI